MARIKGVSSAQAGLQVKIAYHFTRRSIAKLTGRETERMIEPLEMYAHVPVLFKGYAKLEQATAKLHRLDKRLHALAELKAATLTHCEYCIDMGSAISRQWGLTDEEILAVPSYQTSPLFSELDKLVLDYAVGMSRTPVDVPDELFDRLRQHLDDGQIVELTHHIALENMRGRFNLALGIGSAGFSNGMVCAVPAAHPRAGPPPRAAPATSPLATSAMCGRTPRCPAQDQSALGCILPLPGERIICALKRSSPANLPHARNRQGGCAAVRRLRARPPACLGAGCALVASRAPPRCGRACPQGRPFPGRNPKHYSPPMTSASTDNAPSGRSGQMRYWPWLGGLVTTFVT